MPNAKVYIKQGGAEMVVASGGSINVESGGALKIAGTQVTATADQLNTLTAPVTVRLSSTAVNVGAIAVTPLYTVPAGKTCIVTDVVIRGASGTFDQATDPVLNIGWDGVASGVVASATFVTPTAATTVVRCTIKADATAGAAAAVLNFNVTTAATASTTATVDVFGYLV